MQTGCLTRSRLFSCKYCDTPLEVKKKKIIGLSGPARRKKLGWSVMVSEAGNINYDIDQNMNNSFVEALREAQPYIFAFTGRTFVVVLSAEIVASPCLDSILKKLRSD